MPDNPVKQTKNVVFGDMAGGDIHKSTIYQPPESGLQQLAKRFRMQCAEDERLSAFIERLQHFAATAPNRPSRNLEAKLDDSGRSDLIPSALALKELFTKKLAKLQFSPHAQEIFAHILSRIHAFFDFKVRPRLAEGATRAEIDELTYNDLLLPIYNEVVVCKLIDLADLQGMTYFLAGNCHISWDR